MFFPVYEYLHYPWPPAPPTPPPPKIAFIRHVRTGLAIEAYKIEGPDFQRYFSYDYGVRLDQHDSHNHAQLWTLEPERDVEEEIFSLRCVRMDWGSLDIDESATKLLFGGRTLDRSQRWYINSDHTITNAAAVDVALEVAGDCVSGQRLTVNKKHGGDTQQFKIEEFTGMTYEEFITKYDYPSCLELADLPGED